MLFNSRDVAEYLHSEGLASQGHGDMLFRTPREWSQIGKFERKKAIEIETQEAINFAKVPCLILSMLCLLQNDGCISFCLFFLTVFSLYTTSRKIRSVQF